MNPLQTAKEILAIKAAVRARDNHCCTRCGMTHAQHVARYTRTLDVHRLTPGSAYSLDGCVTLCRPCHSTEPKRPDGCGETSTVKITSQMWEQLKVVNAVTGERMNAYVARVLGPIMAADARKAIALLTGRFSNPHDSSDPGGQDG